MNDFISINEQEMNNIVKYLEKSSNNVGILSEGTTAEFSSFRNADLFCDGISKINQQIGKISNSITNVKNIIVRQNQVMEDSENRLFAKAEQIEIPRDFIKNDSSKVVQQNDVKLCKNDGKTISKDDRNILADFNFNDDMKHVNIYNQNNNSSKEFSKYSDNYFNDKLFLQNINNNNDIYTETYDDSLTIEKEVLKNVNNDAPALESSVISADFKNTQKVELSMPNSSIQKGISSSAENFIGGSDDES